VSAVVRKPAPSSVSLVPRRKRHSRQRTGALCLASVRVSGVGPDATGKRCLPWRTTIARNPECWLAHTNLGNALFREGRVDSAIGEFREAHRLKPDLAEAHTSLGVAFASRGKVDEAISQFREAIGINPEYAEGHYDLGLAFTLKGETELATLNLLVRTEARAYGACSDRRIVAARTLRVGSATARGDGRRPLLRRYRWLPLHINVRVAATTAMVANTSATANRGE
jgi:hypothetical protein